jgi:hypothetical protein
MKLAIFSDIHAASAVEASPLPDAFAQMLRDGR